MTRILLDRIDYIKGQTPRLITEYGQCAICPATAELHYDLKLEVLHCHLWNKIHPRTGEPTLLPNDSQSGSMGIRVYLSMFTGSDDLSIADSSHYTPHVC